MDGWKPFIPPPLPPALMIPRIDFSRIDFTLPDLSGTQILAVQEAAKHQRELVRGYADRVEFYRRLIAEIAARACRYALQLPACWNREPFAPGYWARNGEARGKPRYRWVRHTMTGDCGAWKAPDGATPEPVRAGWRCEGCRWKPV